MSGEVNDFDTVAKNLMTEYIQSIRLAPAGVVSQVYPAAEGGVGTDIFANAARAKYRTMQKTLTR